MKKHRFLVGLILFGISLAFAGYIRSRQIILISSSPSSNSTEQKRVVREDSSDSLESRKIVSSSLGVSIRVFLDQHTFEEAWRMFQDEHTLPASCEQYRGGMVNHHTLALDLLVHFFQEAAHCRPDVTRVIVLSPDHYLAGKTMVTTQQDGYDVYGQSFPVNLSAIHALQREVPTVQLHTALFINEHGVGALVPFIQRAWPTSTIIPVVVRSDLDQVTANQLSHWIKEELLNPHTFFIVSSDMSHYLTEHVALQHDEVTRTALMHDDLAFFWQAKDGYTDNGKGIWLALNALSEHEPVWYEKQHAISTRYGGSAGYTTSYLTGFWK